MGWRVAKALIQLRREVNRKWPDRPVHMDGSIGDLAHAKRVSDHNPNRDGVVCAVDITEWVIDGKEMNDYLAEFLRASRDRRLKYVISDGRIFTTYGPRAWQWRKYTGSNGHYKHLHISVHGDYDDDSSWGLADLPVVNLRPLPPVFLTPVVEVDVSSLPVLRVGSTDTQRVRNVQALLIAHGYPMDAKDVDGDFGPTTKMYVQRLQGRHGLDADGIVGANTWKALLTL